jgi:flagellar motor switch protein FliN/FliY
VLDETAVADETPNAASDENQAAEAASVAASEGPAGGDNIEAPVNVVPVSQPASVDGEFDLSQLPAHTQSLLKIKVAVSVDLAHQRRPIHEIIEMGPGTLVKFEKTYDEPLELTVDGLPIARGEVV